MNPRRDIRQEIMDRLHTAESAVEVVEVRDDDIVLDLPKEITDCSRVIPRDAVRFGDEAQTWFLWDMHEKVPRAPHRREGYSGRVKWGRSEVSENDRVGSRFVDVMSPIDGDVRQGSFEESWRWHTDDDGPRPLFPLMIMPHSDFSPEPGLIFMDYDDIVDVQDDGTGLLSKESWDIMQRMGGYVEVSASMTGCHQFVRGRIPETVDGRKAVIELETGKIELWGFPGNGRICGTTWAHIEQSAREIPHRQDEVKWICEELIDDSDKLSDTELIRRKRRNRQGEGDAAENSSEGERGEYSPYWSVSLERIADVPPYSTHTSEWGENGPHPVHGATSKENDDADSTNFGVDGNAWKCWACQSSGGPLHMISVMEVDGCCCGNVSELPDRPKWMLEACLAARDIYNVGLDERDDPPLVALKGVLEEMDRDYPDEGRIPHEKYKMARNIFDILGWDG